MSVDAQVEYVAQDEPPRTGPETRFGLLDAMVLVAATAAGMGLMRATYLMDHLGDLVILLQSGTVSNRVEIGRQLAVSLSPVLAMWSLAAVVLVVRRGRQSRPGTQPGFVAGVVATLGVLLLMAPLLLMSDWWVNGTAGWIEVPALMTGYATLMSWASLALAGAWSPRAHWLDRLGRVLGSLWIGLSFASLYALL